MSNKMIAYAERFVVENVTRMTTVRPENKTETFDPSLICRNQDDVIQSRVVATVHAFLNACVPRTEILLPEKWNLCTASETFDCEAIFKYTSACQFAKHAPRCPSSSPLPPPAPCSLDQVVDQTGGIFLLLGILLLGVLIGLASTVAICLIFPKLHSWMLSKLHTKVVITREKSYESDYTDIDDRMVQPGPGCETNDMVLYRVSSVGSDYSDYSGRGCETGNTIHNSGQRANCDQLRRDYDCQLQKTNDKQNSDDPESVTSNTLTVYSLPTT